MTDILLVSDSPANINIAWRHFCYKEYNASATVSIDAAMENLSSDKPPKIVVYYYGSGASGFISFYNTVKENEKSAKVPLVVLADVEQQKALLRHFKLENTAVLGISIDDSKLMDIMRMIARKGTADIPALQLANAKKSVRSVSDRLFSSNAPRERKIPDTMRRRGGN